MKSKLNKEQVASRQLDAAIELLFIGGDIVSVLTLASAASTVFADLLGAREVKSWREHMVECFPGQENEVVRVMREAQNFFKHADRDPTADLEFDELTNDETIIVATLEYGELLRHEAQNRKVTTTQSVFQMWYFAKAPEALLLAPDKMGEPFVNAAQSLFPDLGKLPRFRQLAEGTKVLKEWLAKKQKA